MAHRDKDLTQSLKRAGISDVASLAALDIDATMQRWRRRITKKELGQRAISDLGLDLDLNHLDALLAVWSPANEYADAADAEVLVGTVAERLNIDPSRASRLAAELIRRGLVMRDVSQLDARRAVLKVTPSGDAIVAAVRSYKFLIMGSFLNGWTAEELAAFVPLLDRFANWMDGAGASSAAERREIAALREKLAGTMAAG